MPNEQLYLEVVQMVRDWNNLAKRTEYERRLHELGPAAVETLLALVRQEVERYRIQKYLASGFFLLGLSTIFLPLFFAKGDDLVRVLSAIARLLCMWAAAFSYVWRPRPAAKVLAELEDIRAVGLLIESWSNLDTPYMITDVLVRQLPQMKTSDACLLTTEQRKKLYSLLAYHREETLQLAVLKALEQIGDGAALSYVEKLANPSKEAKVSEEVQEAARACLPFLTQRAEQERLSMTLLRAAGTMETQSGELLRPAATNVESDPRALLRATQQD